MPCHHFDYPTSRRDFLRTAGCGFGAVALAALLKQPMFGATGTVTPAAGQLKTNLDSGIFQAVQWAAIEALRGGEGDTMAANEIYYQRHLRVASVFNQLGWNVTPPKATFYVWAPVPRGYDSISFAGHVLDQVGVNITPGVGFGAHGEGYFRLSVTAPDRRLDEALERLRGLKV